MRILSNFISNVCRGEPEGCGWGLGMLGGIIIILLTFFLIGWGIHCLIRKLKR